MVMLGLILLIVGAVAAIHVLFVVGLILLLVGLVLNVAPGPWVGSGTTRRRYW
jgi:hypothetical protein